VKRKTHLQKIKSHPLNHLQNPTLQMLRTRTGPKQMAIKKKRKTKTLACLKI
jgi:hypothetical protein